MSVSLLVALLIPWIFWGVLMGLLFMAGRSWINLLIIPVGLTAVILLAANFTSDRSVLWGSLGLHAIILIVFLWSYISFMLGQRQDKR